ncbi:glycosyltransferase [Scytonema sp. UIC 10036]|uniref:glycosyltransferase n=1 Tax=Scytonema sp. UIC 10036 TaxID=2304196 RepID=UPI0012DA2C18|nr:glycosyltransferase [Scytonema sp. UIC 10036]MUG94041.1 glycosyltransferase [Scytonema sp. UIC 10036]
MRIAFVSTMAGYPWGGSEYLWAAAAAQALEEGHEVFISIYDWSTNHPLITKLQHQGARLLARPRFPKYPCLLSKVFKKLLQFCFITPAFSNSLYKSVFDCHPDIICISQGSSYEAIYIPDFLHLLSGNSIPYIVICQFNSDTVSLDSSTRNKVQRFFNQAAGVAFVSHDNLKLAERQLAQSLSNAVIVQNPVNLLDCSLVPCPPQSTVSFASVARLEAACKGQDVLLEALSFPTWKQRDWQCCLYGSGPDQAYLEALAQHYGIGDRIKFMGHINDVRAIWEDNHILVLPSRAEGTPLALVEAMLCGRPAVVTDVGGNTEWIKESQTGFIAEAPTTKSFSAALERAWLVQDEWKQMGVKAHEYAKANFDPLTVQKLLNMILNATKRK